MGPGRLIESYRTTTCRRVQAAPELATEQAQLAPGRHVETHALGHSYIRHALKNVTPLNYLIRWLGHADIETTLIYLELVPDPTGNLVIPA